MPSYLDQFSDDEEGAHDKQTATTSKSSGFGATKKKIDRVEQLRSETEFNKASEHPDVAKGQDKSKKRSSNEGPSDSPKKVCLLVVRSLTNLGSICATSI